MIQAEWMQFVQYAPERGGPGSLPIKVALMSQAGADYRHGSIQPGAAGMPACPGINDGRYF